MSRSRRNKSLARTRGSRAISILVLLVLSPLLVMPLSAAAQASQSQSAHSTMIVVAEDGGVTVNQTITFLENETSVALTLLSPSVGDIVVLNQENSPVSYQVGNGTITMYSLGDTAISLSYDTDSMTAKQGSIWMVSFAVANATLVLPYRSTVLSISAAPNSDSLVNGSPTLVLGPGSWQLSYGLPLEAATSTRSSTGTTSPIAGTGSSSQSTVGPPLSGTDQSWIEIAIGIVAAALVASALVLLRRRLRPDPSLLRADDVETLRFLRDRGGKVVEAEIRERFSAPRTSAWRQIKRLEQMGYVRVSKLGSQNQIELLRNDFDKADRPA